MSWLASVREFPETKKERVPSKHFEFPEVSMETRGCLCSHSCSAFWQLSSFPESESWFGAKSEAKPRKPANYAGIFQVYQGFSRYVLCMYLRRGFNFGSRFGGSRFDLCPKNKMTLSVDGKSWSCESRSCVGCPQDPKKERKKKWATPDRSTSCWRVEILRV